MGARTPRVGIGLPVYNGERYLEQALDGLLAQTFEDFEVVVCDNASDDATERIGRAYAERDPRVRYHRNERNLGAAPNFNLAFDLTRGPLFKWAAADDALTPDYLAGCVAALDERPDAVLCHTEVQVVDDEGHPRNDHWHYRTLLTRQDDGDPRERFRDLVLTRHYCFDVFGVIRRDVLARTPRIASYVGSDRVLLAELGLYGPLLRVPGRRFLSRDHGERSIRRLPTLRERVRWFDAGAGSGRVYPQWRQLREYARAVGRVGPPAGVRASCYATILRRLKYNWKVYRDELIGGFTERKRS